MVPEMLHVAVIGCAVKLIPVWFALLNVTLALVGAIVNPLLEGVTV